MKKYIYKKNIQEKLSKILGLCYQINCVTDYALFCDFSGHVNSFNIRISEDKDTKSTERLADTSQIYLSPFIGLGDNEESADYTKVVERIDEVINNLEKLLPQKKVIEI